MGRVSSAERASQKAAIGRYQVQSEIATGGMGVVYRVRDRLTGELQALKRVATNASARRQAVEALELEYRVLSSLDHPRIIRVFDYGVDPDGPYYTMELLEGRDMRRAAPLQYRAACSYLRDVSTSLTLLHGRRLLHRDLSPSNVRVTPDGHCKLFDFGALAAFGTASNIVGTPPLIAPEAVRGGALNQRTDLYSLGALAYWMLTGRHAYSVRNLSELEVCWLDPIVPPSVHAADVPRELDELVLSLLSQDPLARPSTAAEVIARLDVIAELPPEDSTQTARLARSFFVSPRYTGRWQQLRELTERAAAAVGGKGGAIRIEAMPGLGRTRLLEEVAVQARTAGATVLCADASMSRQLQGTAHALVSRLFELVPELAREQAPHFYPALAALGRNIEGVRLPSPAQAFAPRYSAANTQLEAPRPLAELFVAVSRQRPLLIQVDNFEDADDASQGLVASLASLAQHHALLVVVADVQMRESAEGLGLQALRRHSESIELGPLSRAEMLELLGGIFAGTPNLERFSDWLQQRAAGSPLHAIEICRRLLSRGVIRYSSGLWALPAEQPDAELPVALSDALTIRLATLSEGARTLAECLSLQRDRPTLELCGLLCADASVPLVRARELLDELVRADVLHPERNGYRFTSSALRGALLQNVKHERLEAHHRRLGEAFAQLAGDDLALRIEAGFHLIEGDDELRGADMVATATRDSAKLRALLANLYRAGRPVEAALKVYRKHRRSLYERMPLLAALAQAGYYEAREFGERYGDEAVDALEHMTGLATARRLRRYLGGILALLVGLGFAYWRFVWTPRAERKYSFHEVFQQLFGVVLTLSATAALSLDAARSRAIAKVVEPYGCLPARTTPAGLYEFVRGLSEIPRENEVAAYASFERILERFSRRDYYPSLSEEGRALCIAGAHFARGSFAVFHARSGVALESATALEATGFKLYAMIASQLRFLYYASRGEFALAEPHRDQVELHAAHMGSVWQVETWESAALILIHAVAIGEVVSATRLVDRLEELSRTVPSLKRYHRLALCALIAANRDRRYLQSMASTYAGVEPRSYIGWAATQGAVIRAYNHIGEFSEAKAVGERALQHVTDEDRELVALFLPLDVQLAAAEAGLGEVDAALARLDKLAARFADCDHPLLHGMVHETRAYICWEAKRLPEYEHSLAEVERWYRPTGTPALIAKCERLAGLANTTKSQLRAAAASSLAPTLVHDTVADDARTISERAPVARR